MKRRACLHREEEEEEEEEEEKEEERTDTKVTQINVVTPSPVPPQSTHLHAWWQQEDKAEN